MSYASLPHRGVIRLSGEDRADFLQGLVTQDMRRVAEGHLLYACLLTPQGKYLADFYLTQREDYFLLDVDLSLAGDLVKRLTMFKLRSRVAIDDVSADFSVHAFWQERPRDVFAYDDPRAPGIGWRVMTDKNKSFNLEQEDYTLWQLQNGLPDLADFARERTMMLEANMDLLNAVSWEKGCYMGQELTARTHYRGLIKKRFLPVCFENHVSVATETPVEKEGKVIGFTRSQKGKWALALLTLDGLKDKETVIIAGEKAAIRFPEWFSVPA